MLLIDLNNIKANSYLHDNINDNKLTILAERVEQTYLESLIGTEFLNDLKNKKQQGTLSADEEKLINEFIAPCYYVAMEIKALYAYNVDFRNLTVGSVIDTQIRPLSGSEMDKIAANKQHELVAYEYKLLEYLKENATLFPKWLECGLFCGKNKVNSKISFL